MDRTFTLVFLMAALTQARVLMPHRRLMQDSNAPSSCVTYSLVSPFETAASRLELTKVWGIKILPNRPTDSLNPECIRDSFEAQMPGLYKLQYTALVTKKAAELIENQTIPKFIVLWHKGEEVPVSGLSRHVQTERVYECPDNQLLSTFAEEDDYYPDSTVAQGWLVKHSFSGYHVDPAFLANLVRPAIEGLALPEKEVGRLVDQLRDPKVRKISYELTKPSITQEKITIDELEDPFTKQVFSRKKKISKIPRYPLLAQRSPSVFPKSGL